MIILVPAILVDAAAPTRAQVDELMGLKSDGDRIRGQLDTVGYVVNRLQAEDLFALVEGEGQVQEPGLIGGICPHDDHLYSAAIIAQLTRRITAPRIVLIGVFHKARLWDLEGKLVFDSFEAWHGPWGPVAVDQDLRGEVIAAMPSESVVVSNTMHSREHSLEGIVPFLQYGNREVEIVPILVPYLNWQQLESLSANLADTLLEIMGANNWQLGRDLAIVISNDAVHYGPDFEHAPFGVGVDAYTKGVERDHALIAKYLEGPIESTHLEQLHSMLVNPENPRQYRLPWCGRFSVPFGLEVIRKLNGEMPVRGEFLKYGTSLSEPEPAISEVTRSEGLGYTAPSNLHHWVGFFSLAVTR